MTEIGDANQRSLQTITYSKVVNLSHAIHHDIPQWAGDPPVEFEPVAQISEAGFYLRRFSLGEHTGTHMNAPISFHSGGVGIDAYGPESLIAPAVVMNVSEPAAGNPDYLLTPDDVQDWERQFGRVPQDSIILLYSGWQKKWDSPQEYLGLDADGVGHFPGFGMEAVRFLITQRRVRGLGIDTHGVDGGSDQTYAVNRLALEEPRIVLENLTNLDQLPATGFTLVIGILRLLAGSGSPASALALIP